MSIRKIGLVSRTYRHVSRYRQILTVLVKYGFEEIVERLRIGQYIEVGLQLISRQRREHVEHLTRAQRVRMVLEELGPTFIKLGQVLSTRPDLVPADFVAEFRRLQHEVPPFPFDRAKPIIEEELGHPLEELFEHFDETPMAAASIGQAHRARLRDGDEVVVKVQRPGIREIVEVDLEILLHLATLTEKHVEEAAHHKPTRIVEEFSAVIERELNFKVEAAHLERFASQFLDNETVYVPKVYHNLLSGRVLVMEYIDGVNPCDFEALDRIGVDRKVLTARAADLLLQQIFVHGFFHADPHPGNILVLPGNVLCYLDFGMMGRLDRRAREDFASLVLAIAQRNGAAATQALLRIAERDDGVEIDVRRLERDVTNLIDVHLPRQLQELDLGHLFHEIIQLTEAHRLRIPPDMVVMLKALSTMESVGRTLNPEFDIVTAATPYVRRVKLERFAPGRLAADFWESSAELLELAREIPTGLRDLLAMARKGDLKIGFEHRGLEKLLETHDQIANRIVFAIVVAALIVGSSVIVHARIPPLWEGIPVIGLAGYITAGVLGFWILIAMLRHGRM